MAELPAGAPAGDIDALLGPGSGSGAVAARWRTLIIVGGLAAAVAAAFLLFQSRRAGNAVHYVTAPAARGALTVIVTATGSIQPTNKVDISSELSGTIRRVLVDYNSPVKAGEPLAELDTDKLKAALESARAKLNAARAKVQEAEVTVQETERAFRRKTTLAERRIASQHDLDVASALYHRAVTSLASARAEVGVAEADLKLNETNLSKAYINSPINGVVLIRNAEPGQIVASSLQAPILFSIAEDLGQMEVQVDVDEADVGKVREGQAALFSVDAYPDRKFPAQIRELRFASETVQGVVTYKAVLTVDNSELLLRPGMTATAEITVQEVKDALLVPNAALRFSPPAETSAGQREGLLRRLLPGRPRFRRPSQREETGPARKVWMVGPDTPVAVPVVVGATDGRMTEIREGGIQAGQEVIIDTTGGRS